MFGVYANSSIILKTFSLVFSLTLPELFITLDTVAIPTSASLATSLIVGFVFLYFFLSFLSI